MLDMTCPNCDAEWRVKDELAGKKTRCPECEEVVPVPARDEDEDDEEEIVEAVIEEEPEEIVEADFEVEDEEPEADKPHDEAEVEVDDLEVAEDEEEEDEKPRVARSGIKHRLDEDEDEEEDEDEVPRVRSRGTPPKKGSGLKWVLAIVGVLFLLCAGGGGTAAYLIWKGAETVRDDLQQVVDDAEKQREEFAQRARAHIEEQLVGKWQLMNLQRDKTIYEFEKGGTYYIYTLRAANPHAQPLTYTVPDGSTVILNNQAGVGQRWIVLSAPNSLTLSPPAEGTGMPLPGTQALHFKPFDASEAPQTNPTNPTSPSPQLAGRYKELLVGKWTGNNRTWTFSADGKVDLQGPRSTQFHGTYHFDPSNAEQIIIAAENPNSGASRAFTGTYVIAVTDDTLKMAKAPIPLDRALVYTREKEGSTAPTPTQPQPQPQTTASALKDQLGGTHWSCNGVVWQFGKGVDGGTLVLLVANDRFRGTYSLPGGDVFVVTVQAEKVDDLNGRWHATVSPDGKTMRAWRDGQTPDSGVLFTRVSDG